MDLHDVPKPGFGHKKNGGEDWIDVDMYIYIYVVYVNLQQENRYIYIYNIYNI